MKDVSLKLAILLAFTLLQATIHSAAAEAPNACNVTDFGAKGDGDALDTAAIQAAIDACSQKGGGTVFFPAGVYLTGTFWLKDNIRLHLDAGAGILGSPEIGHYPMVINDFPSRTDRYCVRALIRGEGLSNIAITGHGTIDGQGALFRDNRASGPEYDKLVSEFQGMGRYTPNEVFADRPFLIQLVNCRDILVENVKLRNSAMWMQHYLHCEYLTIRGVNVFNHGCRNNDMIDIDCCRNVFISDCYGDTDDDALTLKSTAGHPTENVVITNCVLRSRCNALKAGTESSGGFRNIAVSNCVIKRSAMHDGLTGRPEGLAGIALEIVDGGTLENVTISNIMIEDTSAPIFMRLGNRARPPVANGDKPPVGTFRNISISNVVASNAGVTGCSITGLPGHPIRDVSISNVRISFTGGGTAEHAAAEVPEQEAKYPECTMFGVLPSHGFYCRHVDGLTFRDVDLRCAQADARPAWAFEDVARLKLDGIEPTVSGDETKQGVK